MPNISLVYQKYLLISFLLCKLSESINREVMLCTHSRNIREKLSCRTCFLTLVQYTGRGREVLENKPKIVGQAL